MLTEAGGVPVGLEVDGANRHDSKLARATLGSIPVKRPKPTRWAPQGLCLDKAYDFPPMRKLAREFGFTPHIRSRGEEVRAKRRRKDFKPRRWVVERTHSWMNRFRSVLIRWAKLVANYKALLHLSCALIVWKKVFLLRAEARALQEASVKRGRIYEPQGPTLKLLICFELMPGPCHQPCQLG